MKIDKFFDHIIQEPILYDFWKKNKFFECNDQSLKKPYSIILPPPNITGVLHMGHGFQYTLIDMIARYQRMMSKDVLLQPGMDHAGIATQIIIEKYLNNKGIYLNNLGREGFINKVLDWKLILSNKIRHQMYKLGLSADWSRECFTMDKKISYSVNSAFIHLYEKNFIYRGKYLVHWDPVLLTAISDLEVVYKKENGYLWNINYPMLDGGYVVVSTTRPETLFGDTAIAVHPSDQRYRNIIGKQVQLPLTNKCIPIIADDYVDMNFGTGCVKVTPAHDFKDFVVGKNHNLSIINIFTKEAKLNNNVPFNYRNLDRFVARNQVIKDLTKLGLLLKAHNYILTLPTGDRTGNILEPYLTNQWFIRAKELGVSNINLVKHNIINFIPKHWRNTYYSWMDNLNDWCISRQLWWGHRIPAWYDIHGNIYVANNEISVRSKYNLSGNLLLTQDHDVFDTWFSSALWPFASLGWPTNNDIVKKYYPSNVLITGFDIIFFWVARMIMFGHYFMNHIPFSKIYITGLVRDNCGKKMSKSKGNIIDPIDVIDGITLEELIKKRTDNIDINLHAQIINDTKKSFPLGIKAYGADALRFTFVSLASTSRNIYFDISRLEGYRKFCNKLWHAFRFVFISTKQYKFSVIPINLDVMESWILHSMNNTIMNVSKYMENYRFDLIAQDLYNFVWHDYCDWYIECVKLKLDHLENNDDKYPIHFVLISVLKNILKLLHPIIPFITESIFQYIKPLISVQYHSITVSKYPKFNKGLVNINANKCFMWLKNIVIAIRTMRTEVGINPNIKVKLYISNTTNNDCDYLSKTRDVIKGIAKISDIYITNIVSEASVINIVDHLIIHIPIAGLINYRVEYLRLKKEQAKINVIFSKILSKLNNPNFINHAPTHIVETLKQRMSDIQFKKDKINLQFNRLII